MALQVREVARFSGWQLADLQRTLICIGATFFLLSYGNEASEEAAATLMGGMKLLRFYRGFRLASNRRPYALRHRLRKSTLTTLSLPESLCDMIAAYAELKHASRNEVYNKCLQQGLLAYLKAQATALGTTRNRKDNGSPFNPGPATEEAGQSVVP